MNNSVWAGGPKAYADGLEQHYETRLRELRARLDQCGDASERQAIEQDIQTTQAEYKTKRKDIDNLLF